MLTITLRITLLLINYCTNAAMTRTLKGQRNNSIKYLKNILKYAMDYQLYRVYLNYIIDRNMRTNVSSTINAHRPEVMHCCRQHPRNALPFLSILCSSIFSRRCASLFCIHEFLGQGCVLKRLSPQ